MTLPRAVRHLRLLGGVAALAAMAAGSGLDRLSGHYPNMAGFVPALFAAEAHRSEAAQALRAMDKARAMAAARLAVTTDPVDPRSTALLGTASLLSGQALPADRAFRVAARLGWRDPLTQLYLMDHALRAGQVDLAAMRLDAIFRQNPVFPARDMVLGRFDATPKGRSAVARRLALRPAWTNQFMGEGSRLALSTLRSRAAILEVVPGKIWGCEPVEPLVRRLIETGDPLTAKRLWSVHCPIASRGISDPHFQELRAVRQRSPFDWNLAGGGDIAIAPAAPPSTGVIARVTGASSRLIAWQLLTLPPGTHSLGWIAHGAAQRRVQPLKVSVSCTLGERGGVLSPQAVTAGHFKAQFRIEDHCTSQYLEVWLAPTSTDVRLETIYVATPR